MKKFILLLMTVLMAINFTACQLAVDVEDDSNDKLVGLFITTEHLDLDEDKLFATLENGSYVFKDLDGIGFYSYIMEEENATCNVMEGDKEIFDGNYAVSNTDGVNETELTGKIKFLLSNKNIVFNMNPVFQKADGTVYLTQGQGMTSNGESSFAYDTNAETTINENGKKSSYTYYQKMEFEPTVEVSKYKVLQYNKNSEVLKAEEYSPEEVPTEITPEKGTEYITIEEHSADSVNAITLNKGEETFDVRVLNDKNIFEKVMVLILWENT